MLRWLILTLLTITLVGCNAPQNANVHALTFVATPESHYFRVEPALIDRGGSITLSWEVHGVDSLAIEQYFGIKTAYDVRYDNLPQKGILTIELASSQPTEFYKSQPYIYGATFYLMPNNKTGFYDGSEVLAHTEVKIRCPYDGFFFGVDEIYAELCPLEPAHQTKMDYQAFEKGFLMRRGDTGTIYVFYVNPDGRGGPAIRFTADEYAELDALVAPEVPEGIYPLDEQFMQLFAHSNHPLVTGLGGAVSPASRYDATVQDTYGYAFFQDVAYMTLPDGLPIQYLTGTYTTGWRYVN